MTKDANEHVADNVSNYKFISYFYTKSKGLVSKYENPSIEQIEGWVVVPATGMVAGIHGYCLSSQSYQLVFGASDGHEVVKPAAAARVPLLARTRA
jgi:hypothetical protein